jgi:hypothetical protein
MYPAIWAVLGVAVLLVFANASRLALQRRRHHDRMT